ncbi:MAG: hypothetical protein HYX37_21145 [Rhizobiales bacterium]|nr:hypothetical protein [Hyphomicrobiales bacterium]
MKAFLKTVAINVVLLGFLLSLFVIAVPMALDLRDFWRAYANAGKVSDTRHQLAAYKDESWPAQHFIEFAQLRTVYHDFIVWRRQKFDGKTVHIDENGYRRHGSRTDTVDDAKVWMFGGSTAWGTGSPDDGTIASYLEKASGLRTFNLGETGYNAHQGLNLLMKLYVEGGRPEFVVFYDGVNEVEHKCRKDLTFFSTGQDAHIRQKLQANGPDATRTSQIFRPIAQLVARYTGGDVPADDSYNCDIDTKKADLIARNLVNDWINARLIVEARGGKFVGVLQPVAYVGSPNISYMPDVEKDAMLRRQYDVVYPKIEAELVKAGVAYVDLTSIFNGKEMFYVDFCHVIPKGNEMIAAAIAKTLR